LTLSNVTFTRKRTWTIVSVLLAGASLAALLALAFQVRALDGKYGQIAMRWAPICKNAVRSISA
jgi:hypothetical protein